MDIAVDFDGTFAADPATFAEVVRVFQGAGHHVVLITNRVSTGVMGSEVKRLVGTLMPIIFAGDHNMSKRDAAMKHGYNIQVWLDDAPTTIDHNYELGNIYRRRRDGYQTG